MRLYLVGRGIDGTPLFKYDGSSEKEFATVIPDEEEVGYGIKWEFVKQSTYDSINLTPLEKYHPVVQKKTYYFYIDFISKKMVVGKITPHTPSERWEEYRSSLYTTKLFEHLDNAVFALVKMLNRRIDGYSRVQFSGLSEKQIQKCIQILLGENYLYFEGEVSEKKEVC